MKSLWISVLLASGLLAAGQGSNQPSFSFYDVDADGMISKMEYDAGHQKWMDQKTKEGKMLKNAPDAPTFEDIDTDGDGMINPEEFSAHQAEQRER